MSSKDNRIMATETFGGVQSVSRLTDNIARLPDDTIDSRVPVWVEGPVHRNKVIE